MATGHRPALPTRAASDAAIHPRIAERAIENLTRRIGSEQATAIAFLQQAIAQLGELARKPGCRVAGDLVRDYESVLGQLTALDPDRPPSVAEILTIGRTLEAASRRLSEEVQG